MTAFTRSGLTWCSARRLVDVVVEHRPSRRGPLEAARVDERALAGVGEAEAGRVGHVRGLDDAVGVAARVDLGRHALALRRGSPASASGEAAARRYGHARPLQRPPRSSSRALLPQRVDVARLRRPPPCAKSGRPPPRRPSCFMTSGALTRGRRARATPPRSRSPRPRRSTAETRTKRPVLVPVAEVVHDRGVRLAVEALEARRPDDRPRHLGLVVGPARRRAPPVASFIFRAWISRSRAFSCSRSFAYSSTSSRRSTRAACSSSSRMPWSCLGALRRPPRRSRASTRRVPAEMPCSAVTRKRPISPVWRDVGAAAELLREARHLDDAHPLAVLVAEEGERPVGERLLAAHHLRLDPLRPRRISPFTRFSTWRSSRGLTRA